MTLTATTNPNLNASGKTVFYDGGTVLGTAPLIAGAATLVVRQLQSGSRHLTARFVPDGGPSPILSPVVSELVTTISGANFSPTAMLDAGMDPTWVAVADLNGDGKLDAVVPVLSPFTGSFSYLMVFPGNGDGTFGQPISYTAGTNIQSVAVADCNGDGIPDLIAVDLGDPQSSTPTPATINILLGNGAGTFLPPLFFPARGSAYEAITGDFNNDGNVDIAVANYQDSEDVSVFLGNGDGTFRPRADYATGTPNGAYGLAVGDYNGDGASDLAVAEDNVVVLRGNGDGTFSLGSTYAAGKLPTDVQTADFNGDGHLDFAVANFFDGTVSILLGNGDGTFQPQTAYPAQSGTAFLTVADFNGDGKPDLAAANSFAGSAGSVSILLGNGLGAFPTTLNYSTGPGPYVLAQGDFTGLGTPDLITANYGDGVTDFGNLGVMLASTCVSVTPQSSLALDGNGGTVAFSITVSTPSCNWTASPAVSWINLSTAAGTQSGQITATVSPNDAGVDQSGTVTIAGTTFTITESALAQQFTDVPPSSPYYSAVNLMKADNVTSGCSTTLYCPDDNVTRAQMAVFIVRAVYGSDVFPYSTQPYFQDVTPSTFGFAWIQKLYELGITTGCGPQLYCPIDSVTRAQMAVFLIRARYGSQTAFTWPATAYFTDVPSGSFGFQWIQRMMLDSITSGCGPGFYCPDSDVTRGQMASFLTRGSFNQLLPGGTPVITQIAPANLSPGSSGTFTVTGSNTHFTQGTTMVVPVGGVSASQITVLSPTQFTVVLTAAPNAAVQPEAVYVQTGAEEAVLPSALHVQ